MRILLFYLFFCLLNSTGIAQTELNTFSYANLDTLVTYDVELLAETGPGYARYFVDGEQVRKIVYDSYSKFWNNIGKCRPCYLKTYDPEDNLIRESVQFTDCLMGEFREYYTNGNLKVVGQHKKNDTGDWNNIFNRGYCAIKEGIWTYYTLEGRILKIEKYIDGNLVR